MEIIRLPDNAQHLDVPYLGGPEFDDGEFRYFDQRCGIDINAILRDPASYSSKPEGEKFVTFGQCIQNWFFFGTLNVFLNRRLNKHSLLRSAGSFDGQQRLCLTTEGLIEEFDEFSILYKSWRLPDKSAWCDRATTAITIAATCLDQLTTLPVSFRDAFVPPEVHLHLAIHVHLLDHSAWQLISGTDSLSGSMGGLFDFERLLAQQNLCPTLAKRLESIGCAGLYFALRLPNLTSSYFSHAQCTQEVCKAMNVDTSLYKTQHHHSACQCSFAAYDSAHVVSLIEKHEIPVVQIHDNSDIVEFSYTTASQCDYIAISHVWADGLGNPSGNTLPECQLKLLQAWVSELYIALGGEEACCFWIDTLCIPVNSKEARWAAIQDMHKVYSKAFAVLVVSQDLYNVERPSDCVEALVRIASSNWMTRLWTLQEGVLAEHLFFQFEDVALEYSELREEAIQQETGHDLVRLIGHDSTSEFDRAFLSYRSGKYQFPLPLVWQSLRFRTTSRMTDAPLVVGRLMGLDISRLSQDGEDQMQKFWEIQGTLPLSVLWLSGPKMSAPGLRWAPASLVDPEALSCPLSPIAIPVNYTPQGLEVKGLVAYSLKDVWIPYSEHVDAAFTFMADNETNGMFCLRDPDTGQAKTWRSTSLHILRDPVLLIEDMVTDEVVSSAIIVNKESDSKVRWIARVTATIVRFDATKELDILNRTQGKRIYWTGHETVIDTSDGSCPEAWAVELSRDQSWVVT